MFSVRQLRRESLYSFHGQSGLLSLSSPEALRAPWQKVFAPRLHIEHGGLALAVVPGFRRQIRCLSFVKLKLSDAECPDAGS